MVNAANLSRMVRQLYCDSGSDMHEINFDYEYNELDRCVKLFYTGYKQYKVYIQMCKKCAKSFAHVHFCKGLFLKQLKGSYPDYSNHPW